MFSNQCFAARERAGTEGETKAGVSPARVIDLYFRHRAGVLLRHIGKVDSDDDFDIR